MAKTLPALFSSSGATMVAPLSTPLISMGFIGHVSINQSLTRQLFTSPVLCSAMAASGLQAPHGNKLVNLMVSNKAEYKVRPSPHIMIRSDISAPTEKERRGQSSTHQHSR